MLHHLFEGAVIFLSLQHLIAPALDLMSCLQAWGTRDCNKGIQFKMDTFNCWMYKQNNEYTNIIRLLNGGYTTGQHLFKTGSC